MSNRYKGAIISATPPTTTGGESGVASGAWTLEQQMQLQAAGLWPSQPLPKYIEDVFSTYLYAGTSAAGNVITNNIDLSTNGGLLWIKDRTSANTHNLFDNTRNSFLNELNSASTSGSNAGGYMTSVNTNGFTPSSNNGINGINRVNENYVSWTFRKQPKFFDVVTYTGDGSAPRAISHNLGSTPGCIIVKRTNSTGDWWVFHRSAPNIGAAYPGIGGNLYLNYTDAADNGTNPFLSAVSDSTFTLSTNQNGTMNINGATYVAYIFAHDAGGFGLTGTDNVISCGSFTGGTWPLDVNLGYEPQYVMIKSASSASSWWMFDNMRGLSQTAANAFRAETSGAEQALGGNYVGITSTGFQLKTSAGGLGLGTTNIYIAIRRGPMKVPTDGTSVFLPSAVTIPNSGTPVTVTTNFPVDLSLSQWRNGYGCISADRLRGGTISSGVVLQTFSTAAESTSIYGTAFDSNVAIKNLYNENAISYGNYAWWNFKRAPGFFDEVCWTGNSTYGRSLSHNLAVVPELLITKGRSVGSNWFVYSSFTPTSFKVGNLNNTSLFSSRLYTDVAEGLSSQPTSSVLNLDDSGRTNNSGDTYVAYLFATCAGVSKVGTYTGTAATLQIDCGFTGGARFVLIKRQDASGDWYVWDSARGIVAGNDPYLLLNTTAAEVTSTDYIDTYSAGFEITSTAPAAINASGGTFIFLAIA